MNGTGVTFRVHTCEPAGLPLDQTDGYTVFGSAVGTAPLSAAVPDQLVRTEHTYNPLVHAVHLAFAEHRPLELAPDTVWLAIAQGISQHIALHAEELRADLVPHEGREDMVVFGESLDESILRFDRLLAERSKGAELFQARFSTTGTNERIAYTVTMMQAFTSYYDYYAVLICGIPWIRLLGTRDDWAHLVGRIDALDDIGLDWWTRALRPICEQFVRAYDGDIDLDHWQSIYKLNESYGGDTITGWISLLFPYLRDELGAPTRPNPEVTEYPRARPESDFMAFMERGLTLDQFPSGLSIAPVKVAAASGGGRQVNVTAGFCGIAQREDLALRPYIGWGAFAPDEFQGTLESVLQHANRRPGTRVNVEEVPGFSFPGELARFYGTSDGATIRGPSGEVRCEILPAAQIRAVAEPPVNENDERADYEQWYRFADLADGSHLAYRSAGGGNWSIMNYRDETLVPPGRNPVVARSFRELFCILISASDPDWPDYGRAE